MKKNLISLPFSTPTLIHNFLLKQNFKPISFGQFHIFIILFFVYTSLTAQQHTFTTAGNTVEVPAGVTQIDVKAWGAGGAGGGASNAPVLDARAGAGGGGGAYARSLVSVTAGTILNVTVGLATTGTTASGTAGGNSTITGFESSIFAEGGKGGGAGTAAPVIPSGGAGGSYAGSVGTTDKIAGTNGGNGSYGLLGALISTGAGGAGAGPGGGGGGASVSSLVLLNQSGNPGAILGGGGSGGINSANLVFTGPAQTGGNGARGQVIIDYTCPTYSLTATTAAIVCLPASTSDITLTSTNGGLPTGKYTVTYSQGATTGLTASMTVTTAGTGNFTVSSLGTVSPVTIRITALKSGVCNSPISANNSVDVTITPATVAGAVTGGTTICGGSTSAPLKLSGHVGSILRWESQTSPSSTWVTIPNTAAIITYTSGALAATTQFRAVIQSGTCSILNSTATTVTVNTQPSITLGTVASLCVSASAQSPILTYSNAVASPTLYNITWASSPLNSFVAVPDTSLPSQITIAVPAGTAAGTYTGTLTVKNAIGCISSPVNFNIVVNPPPSITLGAIASVCTSTNAQTTQLNYTAATNSPTTYSIAWNASPTNSFVAVTNAGLSASPITINVPAGTAAGTYTGALTVRNANGCVSSSSNFNVVVNPLPSITLGSIAAICTSANAQTTQLNYTAATNSPTTYSIAWNASPTNNFVTVTNAGLSASPITINVPAGTAAGTYTGTLTVSNANGCVSSSSNFNVIVNPQPSITLGAIAPVCSNANAQTTQLNYTAAIASPTTYTIVWDPSPTNNFVTVTNAGLSSSPITINVPAGTAAGTYTGTLTVSNASGCISNSTNFNVIVNPLPSITLGTIVPVCSSANAQTTQLNYTATTNSPTTYSIVWNSVPTNSFTTVTNDVLSSSPITINVPAGTAVGTYTGTLTVSNANGCISSSSSNFNVVVNSLPGTPIPGTTTQTNCVSATGSVMLSGLIPSITWTITQSGTFPNTYTGTGTTYLVQNLAAGTYTFTVRDGTNCPSLSTSSVVISPPSTNTWNGTAWSTGSPPTNTDAIVFAGNYSTTGNLSGCSCVVNPGVIVTVNSNHTLTIINSVNNNGGSFIFENNSSLLQSSNAVNTGDIVYKRITPPVRRYDLTFWSSPVTRTPSFTLHDLSPNTLWDKYYKYDPISGWIVVGYGAEEMRKGVGYLIRAPQTYDINSTLPFSAVFTGVPNNGPVTISLGAAEKLNLIGNPYPSAVYADQFIFDNQANLYGTLYFWTHNSPPSSAVIGDGIYNYTDDDFAIYNLTGNINVGGLVGTGATSPGNQNPPLGYIAAGQSFLAKSKTGLTVTFTNSMRVSGMNGQFYKTTNTNLNQIDIEKHRMWINLSNTQGAFKQILIGYVTGATNTWDNNYDGESLDGYKYLDFYSINVDRKLVIQGRVLPFDDSDIIPLGYRSAIAGEFIIGIDHTDGDLNNHAIYLEDKTTGFVQDLQAGNFKFTTAIGTFDDRFVLRYGKTLGTDDFENTQNNVLISVKNKVIKLASNSDTENFSEVVIFDISGKMLYNKTKIGTNKLEITNLKSDNQILIVKVILENGNTISKKIIFL